MTGRAGTRVARPEELAAVAELQDRFQREFNEPSPGPAALSERLSELTASGETVVMVTGERPVGMAILRFRRSLLTPGLECYLAELYIVPERRGEGRGRVLMEAALEFARGRGADYIELNTAVSDVAARGLYESLGFSNTEGRPDGPSNLYYEMEL